MMRATVANMKRYYPKFASSLLILGDDGESEYSANPYDYWTIPDEEDLGGELRVKTTIYVPVEDIIIDNQENPQ